MPRYVTFGVLILIGHTAACGVLFKGDKTASPDAARERWVQLKWEQHPPEVGAPEAPTQTERAPEIRPDEVGRPALNLNESSLWDLLSHYQDSFLKNWKSAFAQPAPQAIEVLDAFNELAYAVTGPGGFWRKTVPQRWLGCPSAPTRADCMALRSGHVELAVWDEFQSRIALIHVGGAARFLETHSERMKAYLTVFAPLRPNIVEMERTTFYKRHLARHLSDASHAPATQSVGY